MAACVAGIHLEGPFLSPVDGARGVHDPAAVRAPDQALIDDLQHAADGSVRLVTLAPELDGGIDLVGNLVGAGIAVAIGHTTADEATIRAAADAGATLSTHLGNGCEAQLDRHDNPVLAQLGEDRLTATLIADGHHLPPRVLRTFVRAKSVERVILTTDAMAAAAAPPGRYELAGRQFEVSNDQMVRVPGTQMFSGSALTLDAAVRNTAAWCGLPLAEAIRLATHAPAAALGEPDPDEAMRAGTFVVAADDGTPVHTVVAGRAFPAVAS